MIFRMWVAGAVGLGGLALAVLAPGQAAPTVAAGRRAHAIEIDGELPLQRGLNVSVTATSQHDSDNGWTSLLLPDVAWRFDDHFSVDASLPVFTYINTEVNTGTRSEPDYVEELKHHALGDVEVNGTYEKRWDAWQYTSTVTLGLPSGRTDFGLGAGKFLYGFSNHVERSYGSVTPGVELAVGNSSNAVGVGPILPYIANATFLYFQAGATVDLTSAFDLDTEWYEALPLTRATIYSTTNRGRPDISTREDDGTGEDNGVNISLNIPVLPHVVLSGFYTRSLLDRYDIGGFSLTFSLHPGARRTRY